MNQAAEPGICKFLTSRQQYRSCRVHVPDLDRHVAAISLDGQYYSFFKVVDDADSLFRVLFRLSEHGDHMVVINSPKGSQVWIWEHEATPLRSPKGGRTATSLKLVPSCQILTDDSQYSDVLLQVPDLDKPVPAVQVQGTYFSIFRESQDSQEVLELAHKISDQALDDFVIVQQGNRYHVCLPEPDAKPIA